MAILKLNQIPKIETLARIHLTKHEDIQKVVEWGFENRELMTSLTTDKYPLKEAVIKYSDIASHHFKTYEAYENLEGTLVLHSLYYYGELYIAFIADVALQRYTPIYIREKENWGGEEKINQYMYESFIGVQSLMAYMLHYREDFEYKEVRKQKNKKGKSGKKKKNTRVVKIGHYYMNDNTVQQRTTEKRSYNRQTEAWRVRGHWRTYKSGKKVWIKPQIRGKKDGKIKPTTYTV